MSIATAIGAAIGNPITYSIGVATSDALSLSEIASGDSSSASGTVTTAAVPTMATVSAIEAERHIEQGADVHRAAADVAGHRRPAA